MSKSMFFIVFYAVVFSVMAHQSGHQYPVQMCLVMGVVGWLTKEALSWFVDFALPQEK